MTLWSPDHAFGQSPPPATISSPGNNATVTVPGGSHYLLVKVAFPLGYMPSSCSLTYLDSVGGTVVYAQIDEVPWYFESPTGLWVGQVSPPVGTKAGLKITVRGWRGADSSGFPGGFCTGTSTDVTVTKDP